MTGCRHCPAPRRPGPRRGRSGRQPPWPSRTGRRSRYCARPGSVPCRRPCRPGSRPRSRQARPSERRGHRDRGPSAIAQAAGNDHAARMGHRIPVQVVHLEDVCDAAELESAACHVARFRWCDCAQHAGRLGFQRAERAGKRIENEKGDHADVRVRDGLRANEATRSRVRLIGFRPRWPVQPPNSALSAASCSPSSGTRRRSGRLPSMRTGGASSSTMPAAVSTGAMVALRCRARPSMSETRP